MPGRGRAVSRAFIEVPWMAASAGRTLLWTFLGGIVGTALGEIFSRLLPVNALTRFLTASVALGSTHPMTLDIRVMELTFGALLRVNLLGIAGAVVMLVAQFRHS
jgi:uncharacterized protein DUF4321